MTDHEDPLPVDNGLSAELLDGLAEAVVKPDDARARAQVISEMVHEVDEAVKWRHQQHPGSEEEQSLAVLVEAAANHQERMAELSSSGQADDEEADPAEQVGPRRRLAGGSHPAPLGDA